MSTGAVGDNRVLSLARDDPIAFIVAYASEALRKEWDGAINTVMYMAGKSSGKEAAKSLGSASTLEEAVKRVNDAFGGHWRIDLVEKEGSRYAVFSECMLRGMYRSAGLDDVHPLPFCFFHAGFIAGILEEMLGRRVDLKPISRGAERCLEQIIIA